MSPGEARELQSELARQVCLTPMGHRPLTVAGLDCALGRDGQRIFAAAVVVSLPGLEVVETAEAVIPLQFPYVPGLLSFREAPACLEACQRLRHTPDLFMVDGQGIAHPRRLGLAAHLGLFLGRPTIGCAKSRLVGIHQQPASEKGKYCPLLDERTGEVIGAVVRTRTNVRPVYVSPGHECSLADAIAWTLRCTTRYRLAEPIRLAHHMAGRVRAMT